MANTRGVEALNGLGNRGRLAERTIALRGLAKINGIAPAEGTRRDVERFLVSLVDPRKEEMSSAEPAARTDARPWRLLQQS